jgi:hypothetical protein
MSNARYSCLFLMKLEISRQVFEKILKYQISLKVVQWEQSCSIRTDRCAGRHDEANNRFSQFYG